MSCADMFGVFLMYQAAAVVVACAVLAFMWWRDL